MAFDARSISRIWLRRNRSANSAANTPHFEPYQPVLGNLNPSAGFQNYLGNVYNYNGQVNNVSAALNAQYQNQIRNLTPQLLPALRNADRSTAALTRGEVPEDVMALSRRNAAQQALIGGFLGSGAANNLTLRDLGRTSLDAQQQGLGNLSAILNLGQRLTPLTAAKLFGSPTAEANRADRFELQNSQLATEAAKNNAGVQSQNNVNDYYAGLAGVNANNISPGGAALASGIGSLAQSATSNSAGSLGNYFGSLGAGDNRLGQNYQGAIDWSKMDWSKINAGSSSGSGRFGYNPYALG